VVNLVHPSFLGWPCGDGVSQEMADRLAIIEDNLRQSYAGSGSSDPFETWCQINESHIGFRAGQGYHGTGTAIDVNYTTNPYIVTRTGSTLGGEAAANDQVDMRQRVIDACDRAVQFLYTSGDAADLSIRARDSIGVTYDRFQRVSDALIYYLTFAFTSAATRINRPPIHNVQDLPDGDPDFDRITSFELRTDKNTAISDVATRLSESDFIENHPDWPLNARQQFYQILRDYELVRTPMLFGNPQRPIVATRNPARGFLDLRKELVVAMVQVGNMRWGASDFGANFSGDMQHFDLGHR
jgi:hypothetical protein